MDENYFFRNAVPLICGNLEIEEAMFSTLQLLGQEMPVNEMYLQYFDHDYKALRSIAYANEAECRKLDLVTSLSPAASGYAGGPPQDQDAFLIEDPAVFPVSREMGEFHNTMASSLIVMALRIKKITYGYLVFVSTGKEKFVKKHLDWVLLLKEAFTIALRNTLTHREVLKLKDLLEDDNRYLHGELRRLSGGEIVGANFGLKNVMFRVYQVAALDSPVLLLGETGVGKDVIANAIHYSSSRSTGPFVSVNCGAIPDTLIDSELFGHEKGAFTGALFQKRGRFERADKGTLFLDEIGELPLEAQVRLLRVLEKKEIERVGGMKTIPLDIRIIAASNRNLEDMVKKQRFREDLWFRINVFPINIPPVRERKPDIPALVQYFISRKSKELKLGGIPTIVPGSIDQLMAYHWPGNVRELQNVIEHALILNPKGPLSFEYLKSDHPQTKARIEGQDGNDESYNLDMSISRHIRKVLIKTGGKINGEDGAAKLLGVNANTLRNRMKKLGISYGRKQHLK